jgi:hypothetical protein
VSGAYVVKMYPMTAATSLLGRLLVEEGLPGCLLAYKA